MIASVMSNDNLFHNYGAAKEYAPSSLVFNLATGSSRKCLFEDRNTRPEFLYFSKSFM